MAKIAVLGMGAMGSRMAKALVEAGHEVAVWNILAEACDPLVALGAKAFSTPRQAVKECEFTIAMVWDDEASKYVWLDREVGAMRSLSPGSVALECATLTLEHASLLRREASERGIEFVSAPMSGSLPEADAKTLIFTVGATNETFRRIEPILLAMGKKIHHAGGPLDGISTKLIINGKLAIEYAFAAEMVALMRIGGMDTERRLQIVETTAPFSPRGIREARFMLEGNESVRVKINQLVKDGECQIAQARSLGVPCPLLEAAVDIFRKARDQGYGDSDSVVLARLHEQAARTSHRYVNVSGLTVASMEE